VFHVGAPRVTLSRMIFDQSPCSPLRDWDTVPVKLSGTDVSDFSLTSSTIIRSEVAVMALGSHVSEFPNADTLNVAGMQVDLKIDASVHYVVAFARCVGTVYLRSDRFAEILIQPASIDEKVDVTGGYGTDATIFNVIDVSEYTGMFGKAVLEQIFSKPPQHGIFYWTAAIILAVFTLAFATLHWVALFKYKSPGCLVARVFAHIPHRLVGENFRIDDGVVTLTDTPSAKTEHFYNIVADVVFADSECYKDAGYEGLHDLALNAFYKQ